MKKIEIENRIRQMSSSELQNVATTFQLVGGVFLASVFIEPIISGNFSLASLVTGFVLSTCFFYASFSLAKRIVSKL